MITCNTDYWMVGEKWTLLTVFLFEQLNVCNQRENFEINFLKDFHFYQFHLTEFFPRPKIHVMLDPLYVIFLILITYRKVATSSPSCLEALAGFFKLSM